MSDIRLRAESLSKIYKDKSIQNIVFDNFSYTFDKGNFYVVQGESGCGKTTLLSLLALLDIPDSGFIYFNEQRIDNLNTNEKSNFRKNHLGLVFQNSNLMNELTVIDNILLMPIFEEPNKVDKLRLVALDYLDFFGLKNKANSYPYEISGGERQRVGVIRSVINQPEILIYDEPISNLDEANSNIIIRFLSTLRENAIIIVSSHDKIIQNLDANFIKLKENNHV